MKRMKINFENTPIVPSFWIKVKNEYPELAKIVFKYLLLSHQHTFVRLVSLLCVLLEEKQKQLRHILSPIISVIINPIVCR